MAKLIVSVSEENGNYNVTCEQGTSAEEVMFAIAIIGRAFERQGICERKDFLLKVGYYLEDSQFDPQEENTEENNGGNNENNA